MKKNKVLTTFALGKEVADKKLMQIMPKPKILPRYVFDFLAAKMIDPLAPEAGLKKIGQLIEEKFIDATEKEYIKSQIKEKGKLPLFGQLRARYDTVINKYFIEIPALGENNVVVAEEIIKKYGDIILGKSCWGAITVEYNCCRGKKLYPFVLTQFSPMQVTRVNLEEWLNKRANFTNQEWQDLLIHSIGFEPTKLSQREKQLYIMRLIPFVESNVNLVELGGPGTAKTYFYRNISPRSFVVSGSSVSPANLFYDKLRRRVGIVGTNDVVCFDEISNANFDSAAAQETIQILKDFMNDGSFGRGTEQFSSDCSIVMVGNIDTDFENKCIVGHHQNLFDPLPEDIATDRAMIDRLHGLLPGWELGRVAQHKMSDGIGFMCDYFAEIMHKLRGVNCIHILNKHVDFRGMSLRDQTAISRLASGFIKLLYPHRIKNGDVTKEELQFVIDGAIEARQLVVDQLGIIAPKEFGNIKLEYGIKHV